MFQSLLIVLIWAIVKRKKNKLWIMHWVPLMLSITEFTGLFCLAMWFPLINILWQFMFASFSLYFAKAYAFNTNYIQQLPVRLVGFYIYTIIFAYLVKGKREFKDELNVLLLMPFTFLSEVFCRSMFKI